MLADRRFVTEAGKFTTEGEENEFEKCAQPKDETPFKKGIKKQVVETTCGSHEKTSRDSLN
jgi:hypothetical protein